MIYRCTDANGEIYLLLTITNLKFCVVMQLKCPNMCNRFEQPFEEKIQYINRNRLETSADGPTSTHHESEDKTNIC